MTLVESNELVLLRRTFRTTSRRLSCITRAQARRLPGRDGVKRTPGVQQTNVIEVTSTFANKWND